MWLLHQSEATKKIDTRKNIFYLVRLQRSFASNLIAFPLWTFFEEISGLPSSLLYYQRMQPPTALESISEGARIIIETKHKYSLA